MKTTDTMQTFSAADRKGGLLYPTLLIAAIAVIIFSVLGIAAMTGYLPSALSKNGPDAGGLAATEIAPAKNPGKPRLAADGGAACADCGVVESIRAVESKGQGSGLGAVAGGVVGGILGNQIGGGGGRAAMTVIGVGAGAYTGHEIEKNTNKSVSFQVRIRMNDGTRRTFYERAQPALAVGQKVRVTNNGVVATG
jgi:outer membrane lipoprotein SlyB